HSMFKIPVEGLCKQSACSVEKCTQRVAWFHEVLLIIWDEVIMQDRFIFWYFFSQLSSQKDNKPFGGITVVFGEDFQQILPVVINGDRESIV
ncbi:DNA helicase Pif1 like protein, partial [Lactifluus volemus]